VSDLDGLKDALTGTRIVLKGTQRTIRGALQYLADLEQRIADFENAQPKEGTANEHHLDTDRGDAAAAADSPAARTFAAA
jgi:hypothetical protein